MQVGEREQVRPRERELNPERRVKEREERAKVWNSRP